MTVEIHEGDKFNQLTVLKEVDKRGSKQLRYLCKCDCGEFTEVNSNPLRKGRTKSCGCYRPNTTHGMSGSPEYKTWQGMKQRCNNPLKTEYQYYGGRGISVCDEWNDSFEKFYDYLGNRPGPEYSLDRIDSDGDYEPGNVKWATPYEQWENRKAQNMTFGFYQGETHKTAIYPNNTDLEALVYCTLGLSSEASEVCGKVKKLMRDSGSEITAEQRSKLIDEMGDTMWYLSELANVLDVKLETVARRNLSKLSSRAERGVLQGEGDER